MDYIDTFLKLKAQASGYPRRVRSAEDEITYIRDFKDSEGVDIDRDAIIPNAARRGLAKACLNALWGK